MASLRASQASREVSPRIPASTCAHASSLKSRDDSGALDQRVADVDVELEGDRKFVVHQARGDEDALRVAEVQVAMADRVVAERDVVAVGDHGFFSLTHGQRDEVVGLAFQRGRDLRRHGGDHALEIERVDRDFAGHGVADSVGRLRDGREPNNFGGLRVIAGAACDIPALILHTAGWRTQTGLSPPWVSVLTASRRL